MEKVLRDLWFYLLQVELMTIKGYRPSNGIDGDIFQEQFCGRCKRDEFNPYTGQGDSCEILVNTIMFDVHDPDYPDEWQYDENDEPTCTAFIDVESDEPICPRCPLTVDMFDVDDPHGPQAVTDNHKK